MGDDNVAMKKRIAILEKHLSEKNSALQQSQTLNVSLEEKLKEVHHTFLQQRTLAEETKDTLIAEQLALGKKTKESDLLRRESMSQSEELRNLRDAWNEREVRLQRLEEQRSFYEQQLSQLGEAYQALVDKLSFVVSDHSVRTAPLQVKVGGGYELLSSYLDRMFSEQNNVAFKYNSLDRPPLSPYIPQQFPIPVSPASSPNGRTRPLAV